MKRFKVLFGLGITLLISGVALADVPKLINFQGILRDGSGNPVPDAVYTVRFRIYDDSTAGSTLWEETVPVPTTSGLFSVRLGDGTALPDNLFFTGANRFVGIKVNLDSEMAPRTRLISVPFAFHALRSDSAATATIALDLTCTGCVVGGVSGTILDGSITSEDLGTNSVGADEIAAGAVGTSEVDATQVQRRVTGTAGANQYITAINQDGSVVTAADQVGAVGWNLIGNGGTTPGTNFLGTSDNQALELKVNNSRALRIEPNATSPNLIEGQSSNTVTGGVLGATISGGGAAGFSNSVTDNYGTVGGGRGNIASGILATISGGENNTASGDSSTIGGGTGNIANDQSATIAGGQGNSATGTFQATVGGGGFNTASAQKSTVAGGSSNTANAENSTVAGGSINTAGGYAAAVGGGVLNLANGNSATVAGGYSDTASGDYSAIPGGQGNKASNRFSFAAGRRAKALHSGSFVWGDSTNSDFASTGPNQFLIRASNVGVGTASPTKKLEVAGSIKVGTNDTIFSSNLSSNSPLTLQAPAGTTRIHINDATGNVGVGTTTPANKLDIEGGAAIGATYSGTSAAPSNGLLVEGNVGLGTTAPANKLDVEGGAVVGATYSGTSAAPSNGLLVQGNVGIGTADPENTLHVHKGSAGTVTAFANSVGIFENSFNSYVSILAPSGNDRGIWFGDEFDSVDAGIIYSGVGNRLNFRVSGTGTGNVDVAIHNTGDVGIGIGEGTPAGKLEVESQFIVAAFDKIASDGTVISIRQGNVEEGTISVSGTTVSYNAFTGSHYGWTEEQLERGELVSLTGINRNAHDNPKSEVIYGIKRSSVPNDPACLGSYLGLQESNKPASNENPHLVMAVGNGDMWVVDEGEDIQPGDYLISSSTPGHAMKDDEEKFPIGHIVARAAEGVDWRNTSESINGRKHKKISVLFGNFVRSNPSTVAQTLEGLREIILKQQQEIEKLKDAVFKDGPSEMAETGR